MVENRTKLFDKGVNSHFNDTFVREIILVQNSDVIEFVHDKNESLIVVFLARISIQFITHPVSIIYCDEFGIVFDEIRFSDLRHGFDSKPCFLKVGLLSQLLIRKIDAENDDEIGKQSGKPDERFEPGLAGKIAHFDNPTNNTEK